MGILTKLLDDSTSMAAFEASFNALVDCANMLYAFDATATAQSLAHFDGADVGDTFRTWYFDSAMQDGSLGLWRAVDASNLGPVGSISYRTIYGAAIPGNPTALSTLSSIGVLAGDTIVVNGTTITAVNSEASGNSQVNVTDRLKILFAKMVTAMTSPLGDRCAVEFYSTGKISIQSSDVNNVVTADLTLAGTIAAKIGFAATTYVFPIGICLEGASARWQLVPPAGNVVDVRSLGHVVDGATKASRRSLSATLYGAAGLGYKLIGPQASKSDLTHRLAIDRSYDFRRVGCDIGIQVGDPVTDGAAVGVGSFFDEAAHITYLADIATWVTAGSNPDTEPTNPNSGVDVVTKTLWDGSIKYEGVAIYGAGDASNALYVRQRFDIRGDGNSSFLTEPTARLLVLSADNSAFGHYSGCLSYGQTNLSVDGNFEKCHVEFDHTYCVLAGLGTYSGGNSPDTLRLIFHGQDFRHVWWEQEGFDSSVHLETYMEGRSDPGTGAPAFWFRNGKFGRWSGQYRGGNGPNLAYIDKSTSVGVDSFQLDVTIIHAKGTVTVNRIRNLMGNFHWKDASDNSAPTTGPSLRINRCQNAGNFHATIVAARSREAVRIGDAANNLYPLDCDFGGFSIGMAGGASPVSPFNDDGTENASGFPTTSQAVVIEKMKGGSIRLNQVTGKVTALSGAVASATGNPVVYVPRTAKGYAMELQSGGDCDFICPAGDTITVTAV